MGLKIKIFLAIALFLVLSTGYMYIRALRGELAAAAEVQLRLEGVIDQQKLVMDKNNEDMENMRKINKELSSNFTNSLQEVSDLRKKFEKRDLDILAASKPTELEMRVNRGTKSALRCNEIITGSPLTEEEKTGKVRNNICKNVIQKLIEESKNAK